MTISLGAIDLSSPNSEGKCAVSSIQKSSIKQETRRVTLGFQEQDNVNIILYPRKFRGRSELSLRKKLVLEFIEKSMQVEWIVDSHTRILQSWQINTGPSVMEMLSSNLILKMGRDDCTRKESATMYQRKIFDWHCHWFVSVTVAQKAISQFV